MNLEEKLRKIEALLNSTSSPGEKHAAELAIKRLMEKNLQQRQIEFTITADCHWKKRLFIAVCKKHHVAPYRYAKQRYTTTVVRVTEPFMKQVLWPEFKKYASIFESFAEEIMSDLIAKIHQVDDSDDVVIAGELPLTNATIV